MAKIKPGSRRQQEILLKQALKKVSFSKSKRSWQRTKVSNDKSRVNRIRARLA